MGEGRLAQEEAQGQAQEDEAAQKAKAEAEIPACKDAEWQVQDETVGQMAKPDEESLRHEEADPHALKAPHTADTEAESQVKEEAAKSQCAFPLLNPSWSDRPAGGDRPAAADGRQIATPGVGALHWLFGGSPHHSQEEAARNANAETARLVPKEAELQAQEEAEEEEEQEEGEEQEEQEEQDEQEEQEEQDEDDGSSDNNKNEDNRPACAHRTRGNPPGSAGAYCSSCPGYPEAECRGCAGTIWAIGTILVLQPELPV